MTTLTPTHRRALARHEKVIARGLQTFREVGEALARVVQTIGSERDRT